MITMAKALNDGLRAAMEIDPKVVVGGDTGEPIVVSEPQSPAAAAFRELARQVAEQVKSGVAPGGHHDHDHDHDHAHTH